MILKKSMYMLVFLIIMLMFFLFACSKSTKGSSGNYDKIYEKMEKQDWVYVDWGHYSTIKTNSGISMCITWTNNNVVTQAIGFEWSGSISSAYFEVYDKNSSGIIECKKRIKSSGLGPIQQYIDDGKISFFNKKEKEESEYVAVLNLAINIFDNRFYSKYGITIGDFNPSSNIDDGSDEAEVLSNPNYRVSSYTDSLGRTTNRVAYDVSYSNSTLNLSNIIKVSDGATWQLAKEMEGYNIITSKNVSLKEGSNSFYIIVTSENKKNINVYELSVYRNHMYTISFDTKGGNVIGSISVEEGTYIQNNFVVEKEGYIFNGFTVSGFLVSFPYQVRKNCTFVANYSPKTNTPYKVNHFKQKTDGSFDDIPNEIDELRGITGSKTNAIAKTFEGFESPTLTQKTINPSGTTEVNIYYYRKKITVSTECNALYGSIAGNKNEYLYGEEVNLFFNIKPGYTFNNWIDNNENVSKENNYSFTITDNTNISVNCSPNSNTKYYVYHYKQNVDGTYNNVYDDSDVLSGTTDTSTNAVARNYEGFKNTNFNQEIINGDGSTIIKIYYDRKYYNVHVEYNEKGGIVSGVGSYRYGSVVSITALTKEGYSFKGWIINGKTVTTSNYSFELKNENVSYEAIFEANKYNVRLSTPYGSINGNINHSIEFDKTYTFPTVTLKYSSFVGWMHDDRIITDSNGKLLTDWNISENVTLIAKLNYYISINDSLLYFGRYPQKLENDDTIKSELNDLAGDLPTSDDTKLWTNYGYYQAKRWIDPDKGMVVDVITLDMYYIDIDLDNDNEMDYRGVYFTIYRLDNTGINQIVTNTYQDDNGYSTNTVYWFKYEMIKWNILKEENGETIIIADLIIDSQYYYPNEYHDPIFDKRNVEANCYGSSFVREWLNDTFYNTSFVDYQKSIIDTTIVDNSIDSFIAVGPIDYSCNNTNDKIYLLSAVEVEKYYNDYNLRITSSTDYAKIQGCADYNGYSGWLTRTPANIPYNTYSVTAEGTVGAGNVVSDTSCGVRPVCVITL